MHVFDALLQAVDGLLQLRVARELLVLVVELIVVDLEARLASTCRLSSFGAGAANI